MLLKSPMHSNSAFIFSPDALIFLKTADNLLFFYFSPFSSQTYKLYLYLKARKCLKIWPKQRCGARVVVIATYSS